MNNFVTFGEDGAHFRITEADYADLDEASRQFAGVKLGDQPIEKVVRPLRAFVSYRMKRAFKEGRRLEVHKYIALEKSLLKVFPKTIKDPLDHSVNDIGRLTVDIFDAKAIDDLKATPIKQLEFTSSSYRWAARVVDEHRDGLPRDEDTTPITPVISSALLVERPRGADTALAYQGLRLKELAGPLERGYEIIRLTRDEHDQLVKPVPSENRLAVC